MEPFVSLESGLNEADQWTQINQPLFDNSVFQKILDIRTAMINADARADLIYSQVNGVPFVFREVGEEVQVWIGIKDSTTENFYALQIPTQWLG